MVNHYGALVCMIHHRLLVPCEQMLKQVHGHFKLRSLAACDRVIIFKWFSHYILLVTIKLW